MATDVLGTQEVVLDGETGFLAPLNDIDAMVEKIELLANDADLRNKMGKAGMSRVKELYNEENISRFLYEFYINKSTTM